MGTLKDHHYEKADDEVGFASPNLRHFGTSPNPNSAELTPASSKERDTTTDNRLSNKNSKRDPKN